MTNVDKFPNLYKNKLIPGDYEEGWNNLITELSVQLEQEILQLPEEERDRYYATQIKEKFGGLRFYMSKKTQIMKDLVQKAEEKSITICEECGEAGSLQRDGCWWRTVCNKHSNQKGKSKKNG